MKQTIRLLKGSAIQVFRDQMLLMLFFAPFLIGVFIRILGPIADQLLQKYVDFSIAPYYLLGDVMTMPVGAMTIGMMVGLLMLDERDEGIASYFSITPVGGFAYLLSRLALPWLYSLVSVLLVMPFVKLTHISYFWMIAPIVISACNCVLMAVLLVSIASNKVEGLAVSKLLGIILFGIPLAWFATSYLRIVMCFDIF